MTEEQDSTGTKQTHYAELRIRIVLLMVMVSLVPMILVTGIILYQFHIFSNKMVHAHMDELVMNHSQKINDFLIQKLNDINHLSKSYTFEQLREKEFLQKKLRTLQEDYSFVFVDLGIIREDGRQITYAGPFDLVMADYSDTEWFQQAMAAQTYISDVFLGIRGQPHFIVAVKRQWDGQDWLVRATIDFLAFNTLVEDFIMGKTGTAFILNRQGDFQTRPPRGESKLTRQQYMNLFRMGETALGIIPEGGKPSPAIPAAFKGYKDPRDSKESIFTIEKTGESGEKFIIVAAFLKNNDWLMIFQQESRDAFAKLNNTQKIAVLFLLAGALVIIAMAFFVSGQLVRLISKLDSEKKVMNQQIIETGKLASIGELAAGIAHEINNPVAIMVEEAGWIQDLLSEGIEKNDNMEEFNRALKQIETQGHRCKSITHKLLSFARKTDSKVENIQLNEFISEVIDLLSQNFLYANIEVITTLEHDLPTVQASATEMQQVLMNILQNAVYAMKNTGGKINITTQSREGEIFISISDSGPGIPASNLARIFDPFFTTKPVGKGTGLGLSICYGIINKMGGRIDVGSQMGEGTTFTIVLPFTKEEMTI